MDDAIEDTKQATNVTETKGKMNRNRNSSSSRSSVTNSQKSIELINAGTGGRNSQTDSMKVRLTNVLNVFSFFYKRFIIQVQVDINHIN